MTHALILDGEQRSALAVTRSLIRGGLQVAVASAVHDTAVRGIGWRGILSDISGAGRFGCGFSRLGLPEPRACRPAGNGCDHHAAAFGAAQGDEGYEALTDKATLVSSAQTQKVPVPSGSVVHTVGDATIAAGRVGYPVALKPSRSKLLLNDRVISTSGSNRL